jgi:hypothetical protein
MKPNTLSKLIALTLLTLTLASCFGRAFRANIQPIEASAHESQSIKEGQTHTATPGALMFWKQTGSFYEGFRSVSSLYFRRWKVIPGQIFAAEHLYDGRCKEGKYVVTGGDFKAAGLGIIISEDGRVTCGTPIIGTKVHSGKSKSYSLDDKIEEPVFVKEGFVPAEGSQTTRTELYYGGSSGKVVTIGYRKFGADYSTPIFSKDLTFDTSVSEVIKVDDIVIRVLALSGTEITFSVPVT